MDGPGDSSLPVPLSPEMWTQLSDGATRAIRLNTSCIGGRLTDELRPSQRHRSVDGRVGRMLDAKPSARSMIRRATCRSNGLTRYSNAPRRTASTAVARSP